MMFNILALASVAGIALAAPVPSASSASASATPTGYATSWSTQNLEDYEGYHVRYLALECYKQHNTSFFDDCCHPLKATQNVTDLADYCQPNATASESASSLLAYIAAASPTNITAPIASDNSDEEYCSSSVSAEVSAEVSSATAAPSTWSSEAPSPSATDAPSSSATHESSTHSKATHSSEATSSTWSPEPTSTSTEQQSSTTQAPSTTDEPSSTTSTKDSKPTDNGSGGSGSGQVYSGGDATFFYQNGAAGACGDVSQDSDYLVAIDTNGWWQDTSSPSPLCGKFVEITRVSNGAKVRAQIKDACPTCNNGNSLDLSVGAFKAIATESEGMVPITWQFV